MARIDHWKNERRVSAVLIGEDDEEVAQLFERRLPKNRGDRPTLWIFVATSREIIFDVDDEGDFRLHYVMMGLDSKTLELVTIPAIEGVGLDANDVKQTLALALIEDVPVHPNTAGVAQRLLSLQEALIADGFVASGDEGARFRLTRYAESAQTPEEALEDLANEHPLSPVEAEIIRVALADRLEEHELAGRALTSLRSAIDELTALLSKEVREEELQKCLTRNPSLFGAEYREIKPKHQLGSEFEMDYALVRVSGLVDLVEIERSTHRLFKQSGDPTAALVYAEQQVLDWLQWIDRNAAYARESLSQIQRPMGYVVIGRGSDLSDDDRQRLARWNLTFQGALQILTYDDLLNRAQQLLDLLLQDASSYADPAGS